MTLKAIDIIVLFELYFACLKGLTYERALIKQAHFHNIHFSSRHHRLHLLNLLQHNYPLLHIGIYLLINIDFTELLLIIEASCSYCKMLF